MEGKKTPGALSLSERTWIDPVAYEDAFLRDFCANLNISLGLGRILAARNLLNEDEAYRFLNPQEGQLHSPHLLLGMREAVLRILDAIRNYEKILVFGDYDVDGTASATILFSYLRRLGAHAQYFIPHRMTEGYGITSPTLKKIRDWAVDLVITTDHGSTDLEGSRLLKREGIDLIVTDHHRLGAERPEALALVNPQQPGCPYPFKELSAAGVAFKVVCALDDHLNRLDFFNRHGLCHTAPSYYLDLVALATVADMSPLLGENRILVKMGLEQINTRPKPGLRGLIKECRVRGQVTPTVISFKLAPKINALGRVGDPRLGMRLLLSHSVSESRRLARSLVEVNRERQEIEREAFSDARVQVERQPARPVLVLVGQAWHPGVIGNMAARIAAETRKPTVVLTLRDAPPVMGSARSCDCFNVLAVLEACAPLLERFGGHPNAAGLMLDPANVEAFADCFQSEAERGLGGSMPAPPDRLEIEAWIDHAGLTPEFFWEVGRLSPFGFRNPEPVVAVRGLTVENPNLLNRRHLRFSLRQRNGDEIDAFAWDHPEWDVQSSQPYDIAFLPQTYDGPDGPRTQLRVVDLKPTRP